MSPSQPEAEISDRDRLGRWVGAGGEWDLVGRTSTTLTVALLTCDRGEEMGRIVSSDPDFASYVDECAENSSDG